MASSDAEFAEVIWGEGALRAASDVVFVQPDPATHHTYLMVKENNYIIQAILILPT